MKKFFKKYGKAVILIVLFALLITLSVLTESGSEKDSKTEIDKTQLTEEVANWITETEKDQVIVTVIAQTSCSHCISYKPVITSLQEQYGFKLYWWEVDEIYNAGRNEDYKAITSYYPLTSYEGTPHTYITKGGELVKEQGGAQLDEALLKEFLTKNGVITE